MEKERIECTAKPITHAFIHFKNDEERNKFVRSANMLKKELRGRKLKISRSMDADERFHKKRMGYVKYCIHEKHNIPLDSITTNWTLKHISVKGQIVVKTYQCGNLTYIKYQDIETDVEGQMEKWQSKNSSQRLWAVERSVWKEEKKVWLWVVKCKQQHKETNKPTGRDTSSKMLTETSHHAWDSKREALRTTQKKNEGLKRRGGGRLKYYNVDGDMPLCLR